MRAGDIGGVMVILGLCGACVACGGSPTSPSAQAAAACHDVYHPAVTTFIGNNTFVRTPAWTETVCP